MPYRDPKEWRFGEERETIGARTNVKSALVSIFATESQPGRVVDTSWNKTQFTHRAECAHEADTPKTGGEGD